MKKILSTSIPSFITFVKAHKVFFIIGIIIFLFLLSRLILLRKPNTELTYTVTQENLIDTVQVSGTYTTSSQIQIQSPTNGVISELFVNDGDEVKKGDQLFHVESTATANQQKAAYANYLAANATLQADKASLYTLQSTMYTTWKKYTDIATNSTYQNGDGSANNSNRVLTEFTTAQDNWLAAEAQYKNQQNVIAKDQAALVSAQQAYDETKSVTVTAPISGTVANLLVNMGDQVTAQSQTSSVPVLVIANFNNSYISTNISENYAAKIIPGQEAMVVFDSLKNKTFIGRVENVATVGTTSQGIVTYPARIMVNNLPMNIKPNMTALITIETLRKNNVIDVPNSALIMKDGITYVQQAGSHKLIPVETGTKGTVKTEILKGLDPRTIIVASPE